MRGLFVFKVGVYLTLLVMYSQSTWARPSQVTLNIPAYEFSDRDEMLEDLQRAPSYSFALLSTSFMEQFIAEETESWGRIYDREKLLTILENIVNQRRIRGRDVNYLFNLRLSATRIRNCFYLFDTGHRRRSVISDFVLDLGKVKDQVRFVDSGDDRLIKNSYKLIDILHSYDLDYEISLLQREQPTGVVDFLKRSIWLAKDHLARDGMNGDEFHDLKKLVRLLRLFYEHQYDFSQGRNRWANGLMYDVMRTAYESFLDVNRILLRKKYRENVSFYYIKVVLDEEVKTFLNTLFSKSEASLGL